MAYTITCMQRRPDIGYRSLSRHTMEAAKSLAADLMADGAIEIEVRDDRGHPVPWQTIEHVMAEPGMRESDVLRRLRPA